MDPVLERREGMESTAQHLGLIARLAAKRDEPGRQRAAPAPEFLDNPDAVVRDVAD
jgi:hypothetical protein